MDTTPNTIVCVKCTNVLATSKKQFFDGLEAGKIRLGSTTKANVMHGHGCGCSAPFDRERAAPQTAENLRTLASWGIKPVSESKARAGRVAYLEGPAVSSKKTGEKVQRFEPCTPESKPSTPAPKPANKPSTSPALDPVSAWASDKGASPEDLQLIGLARRGEMPVDMARKLIACEPVRVCANPGWSVPKPPAPKPNKAPTVDVIPVDAATLKALLQVASAAGVQPAVSVSMQINGKTLGANLPVDVSDLLGVLK